MAGILIFKTLCLGKEEFCQSSICLSFLFLCLSSVVSTSYTSLCRGLKCYLSYRNVVGFLILRLFVWTGRKHCPSYGYRMPFVMLRFFGIFIHNWRVFVSEVFYLHQNFTDCVFDYIFSYITTYMFLLNCVLRQKCREYIHSNNR